MKYAVNWFVRKCSVPYGESCKLFGYVDQGGSKLLLVIIMQL